MLNAFQSTSSQEEKKPEENKPSDLDIIIDAQMGQIKYLEYEISEALESCDTYIKDQNELHRQVLALHRDKGRNNESQNAKAEEKILKSLSKISDLLDSME